MNELLVDVSSNNAHPLPWVELVAAGVKGLIIKITEGVDYVNPDAAGDIAGAKGHGLGVSAYHFFHPELPAIEQVGWFGAHLQALPPIDLLWMDLETTGGLDPVQIATDAHTFLASIPNHYLKGPYLNLSELEGLPEAPWGFPLWLADPSHPNPQAPCLIHQFGQQTIGGQVFDVNRFLGTDEQFAQLFFTQEEPPAAPGPTPPPTGGFMPPTLQQGDFSPTVRNLQRLLNVHNGQLVVDGHFGPLTDAAVRNFQSVFKLTVDGIVGPVTWTALDTYG